MSSNSDSLWLFAFLGSKCNSLSSTGNLILTIFALAISYLFLTLLYWFHPGGPAWGGHRFRSLISFITLHHNHNKNTAPVIPGPRGLPMIGSMSLMTGLAHKKLTTIARRLGATRLMAFSLGPNTRVVVTSHPEVGKEILQSPAFTDRPVKESAYGLMFNRSIGFAPYGKYWRTLRKIASAHLFSPKQIKSGESQRRVIASRMVGEVIIGGDGQQSFKVRDVLKKAALSNMMGSVFGWMGYEVTVDEELELRGMVEEGYDLLGGINWADHLPWLADFDLQKIRFRCNRLVPQVNRFVGRIIEEHKGKKNKSKEMVEEDGDFVDVLLSLDGDNKLSEPDMIAVLWEMIFRGTDTVAVLIEWILARMVLHPDIQSKVQHELDTIIGRSSDVTESNLPSLVYLTAAIKESLRLHPPGPLLSWARLSITDTIIDGHFIPAGTTAMVNMGAITRDSEFWSDPDEFNPERFLPGSNDLVGMEVEFSVMGSDMRLAPFGSGRRSCPGKAMGMATVTYWVAALLHEFEWMAAGDDGVDLSEVLKLSCEMATPLEVKVRGRRTASSLMAA